MNFEASANSSNSQLFFEYSLNQEDTFYANQYIEPGLELYLTGLSRVHEIDRNMDDTILKLVPFEGSINENTFLVGFADKSDKHQVDGDGGD